MNTENIKNNEIQRDKTIKSIVVILIHGNLSENNKNKAIRMLRKIV